MKRAALRPKNHRSGFSLLELVVALFMMATLLAVVVPRMQTIYEGELIEQQVRILEEDLRLLRSEAKNTGEDAIFRVQEGGYTLTTKKEGAVKSETRTLVSPGIHIRTSSYDGQIIFKPRGTAYDKCSVILTLGGAERTVVVNSLGRIRVGVNNA